MRASLHFYILVTQLLHWSKGHITKLPNLRTGQCSGWVNDVKFTDNSRRLFSASNTRSLKIWEVTAGKNIAT